MKKYADEMFEANRISEYVHSIIGEAIQNFTLLSPVKLKEMNPTKLDQLSKWINISIYDINGEITDLMSKWLVPKRDFSNVQTVHDDHYLKQRLFLIFQLPL